jgi:hypothetical protein
MKLFYFLPFKYIENKCSLRNLGKILNKRIRKM